MAYPGLTFAILVGVAIGTAIYYYFNQENPSPHQNQHYDRNYDNDGYSSNRWDDSRTFSSSNFSTQRRKRRNSGSKCSICLEDIDKREIKIAECGHEFHKRCISAWLTQQKSCPNCRRNITS